jgi:hypothetical protein
MEDTKKTIRGRRKRTLYIPEEIDKLIRHRAVEHDKKFSDVFEDILREYFAKELSSKESKKK